MLMVGLTGVCFLCVQHCPPGRFLLFATVGLALYVMGPAPLRRAWQRLLAMLPPMHVRIKHPRSLNVWMFQCHVEKSEFLNFAHGPLCACHWNIDRDTQTLSCRSLVVAASTELLTYAEGAMAG